jgi:MATE family multidrug resistance protein
MASNQGHHVGSLSDDYAILSRFAHDNHENQNDEHDRVVEEVDEDCSVRPSAEIERGVIVTQIARRSSSQASYIRPPPTIPSMNFKSGKPDKHLSIENGATENTPLLGPLVPRIEEEPENEDDNKSNTVMFWEELRILSKYTWPIFGSVSLFLFMAIYLHANNIRRIEHISWNTVCNWHL